MVDPGAGTAQSHIHRSLHYDDHEVAKTNIYATQHGHVSPEMDNWKKDLIPGLL